MKKSFMGVISAILLTFLLCACGAKVEVDPPIVTDTPDMTDTANDSGSNSRMGSTNGLAQGDGMQ
ncbi:MAG: hypothetical protein J6L59_03215 [Clostridia bacterium]|nr:hypothetical protein [Clostridia bacterium]